MSNETQAKKLAEKVDAKLEKYADDYAAWQDGGLEDTGLDDSRQIAAEIIALVTAARDAEIREALLEAADGYIVAKGQDGEAEATFATKPWMEQILDHIGLHGDSDTGGQV